MTLVMCYLTRYMDVVSYNTYYQNAAQAPGDCTYPIGVDKVAVGGYIKAGG